jgi:hypothetical protein
MLYNKCKELLEFYGFTAIDLRITPNDTEHLLKKIPLMYTSPHNNTAAIIFFPVKNTSEFHNMLTYINNFLNNTQNIFINDFLKKQETTHIIILIEFSYYNKHIGADIEYQHVKLLNLELVNSSIARVYIIDSRNMSFYRYIVRNNFIDNIDQDIEKYFGCKPRYIYTAQQWPSDTQNSNNYAASYATQIALGITQDKLLDDVLCNRTVYDIYTTQQPETYAHKQITK